MQTMNEFVFGFIILAVTGIISFHSNISVWHGMEIMVFDDQESPNEKLLTLVRGSILVTNVISSLHNICD